MKTHWSYEKIELCWNRYTLGEDREATGYVWSLDPIRLLATIVARDSECTINTIGLGGLTDLQRQILELYLQDELRQGVCICIKRIKEE